jgi:nucleoid-associated protein YgaU
MEEEKHGLLGRGQKPSYIAEHTVTPEDTLGHIALKYYGSAVKEKWMLIYEANKGAIGDNPNRLPRGIVLKIPKLPE